MPLSRLTLPRAPSYSRNSVKPTIKKERAVLERTTFVLLMAALLPAPWFFGAWEMWWYWTFATGVLAAGLLFGLRLFLSGMLGDGAGLNFSKAAVATLLAWIPFLVYAVVRLLRTEVYMDAERSVGLHWGAALVASITAFGLRPSHRQWLWRLMFLNLIALGAYGVINHWITGSRLVLWRPGYSQYVEAGRMTGSYFCPDHFSGIMEILFAMALAMLAARETGPLKRLLLLSVIALAVLGVAASQSRGGILTVGVILFFWWLWAPAIWSPRWRWTIRALLPLVALSLVALALWRGGALVERFKRYPWRNFEHSDRYQMTAAALRAWRLSPVMGIGPGMHRHYWFHVAATPDGDRTTGRWPTFTNTWFHSYEVHNDWAQLLEEYGVAGLLLFLIGAGVGMAMLWRRWRAERERRPSHHAALPLAVLLVAIAMAFHSLGDFNLQMPATVWMFAALIGVGLSEPEPTPADGA